VSDRQAEHQPKELRTNKSTYFHFINPDMRVDYPIELQDPGPNSSTFGINYGTFPSVRNLSLG
jgi:hypothetical protein